MKAQMQTIVPHYVVICGGELFDFKRRVFGCRRGGKIIQAGPVFRGSVQPDGWYPDTKVYVKNVSVESFEMPQYKRSYAQFLVCESARELCSPDWYLVKKCVETV